MFAVKAKTSTQISTSGLTVPSVLKRTMFEDSTTMKLAALALLVIQNASTVIMVRYSRGVLKESYLASSVVLMTEVCKLFISAGCIYQKKGESYLNSQPWPVLQKYFWLIANSGILN